MECIDISGGGKPAGPQQYIFGYGSLIEDASRLSTTPSARNAWPVKVSGIARGWWARGAASGLTTTFLGAIKSARPEQWCNGVIYAVSAEDLAATDRRESAGYQRCRIPRTNIEMLDGSGSVPDGDFWAYLNLLQPKDISHNLPSAQFPMVQSYVDICVNGCLQVEARYRTAKGFTADFFATTDQWSGFWVNDRLYPRRPFIFQPNAGSIDTAIKAAPATRNLYYEIEIEPASWEQRTPVRPPAEPEAAAMAAAEPAPEPHTKPAPGAWQRGG